jgi:2,4-dienoyl-CoA reductase (NADPH2)
MLEKPIRIGSMEVKNRIVKAAVVENMATEDGRVTDALVRVYEKAAQGGAGLIISGGGVCTAKRAQCEIPDRSA